LVLELWSKTRIDWGFATDRVSEMFRRHKELHSAERREVSETLYGMIRQARRLDFALDTAHANLPPGPKRELARYLAYKLLAGELQVDEAAAELPGVNWLMVASVDERARKAPTAEQRLALLQSLPDWLARRFVAQFGEVEATALAAALNERAPLTVRANRLKTTREALAEKLTAEGITTRPTPHAADGLILDTRVNAFGLAAFQEGLFEVQDEASQLVAEVTAPPPRGLVIDACAGAGGKTLALGALMGARGRLLALDVAERKLEELRRRARRAGLHSVRALATDDDAWPPDVLAHLGRCDRVLIDAPCSGIGSLRRNPEARWRLGEAELGRLPAQQERLLRRAAPLVAPGGRLVYATCTVLREENEAVVERFLAAEKGFEPVNVIEILGRERGAAIAQGGVGPFMATLPHVHGTDGFFCAVLRKRAG
jgi:16S rRNA (cytosine967-C5)-methyltransferase